MLLCFVFSALLVILSLLLVIIGGQHDGLLLSDSPPILYIYIYIIFCSWQINSAAGGACVSCGGLTSYTSAFQRTVSCRIISQFLAHLRSSLIV